MVLTKRHDALDIPLWCPTHRQEGFHLAGNEEFLTHLHEIKRLDTKTIPASEESLLPVIP